jgi:hypothetical protein
MCDKCERLFPDQCILILHTGSNVTHVVVDQGCVPERKQYVYEVQATDFNNFRHYLSSLHNNDKVTK